ncbi:4-(cytidine 5'-diphospho)-2-C-methyl-D-erythritol kinase [Actinoallomurus purpureus]|uniref:4-(cytidine 5'-diphospho)-2-C-methyl-D-erythritol kinase n=1 Tax=Actinoallomurus purpureus TaxID=478114 RepID=UPI0020936AC9|nr:4-(cytidine 5'-diphospho)-2-C-methyl-D-erythritol kinase [Actinoallomurus purpureus]MCO6006779.1 4-(cytidine 5'-diphospho)-2-C-methyl-D-erythritol kinase [Actinoallomurus purpureus]
MTVRVPAKVNLQLSVGPVRDDGYHDLVNVFHAVSLFDEVTAVPADALSVTVEGPAGVPTGPDNLAARAATLLAEHIGRRPDVALHIRKDIPVAGGMAGGSADAAAALLACDVLWESRLDRETLLELAARLGSDVPFALLGGTAVGLGRGERLTPVEVLGEFHWVFGYADGGLSTPAVYAECDRLREAGEQDSVWPRVSDDLMAALKTGDAEALGRALHNDLQPAALSLRPSLREALATGRDAGALGAIVSGSGPTCAFLAASLGHSAELAAALNESDRFAAVRPAVGPVSGVTLV